MNKFRSIIFIIVGALGLLITLSASFTSAQEDAQPPILQRETGIELFGVAWSPDGELIAVGSFEGTRIYDTDLREVTLLRGIPIISVDWNSDSTMLASAGGFGEGEGRIQVWERDVTTNDFELIAELSNGMYEEFFVKWSPDGTKLASIGRDWNEYIGGNYIVTIEIWDTQNWSLFTTLDNQYLNATYSLAWSSDSQLIAGGGDPYDDPSYPRPSWYFIADATTGERLYIIDAGFTGANALAGSVINNHLFVSTMSGLETYDISNGTLISRFSGTASRLEVSPSGLWVAQFNGDEIVIRNMDTGTITLSLAHSHRIFSFAWSPDGNYLIATSEEGTIEIWDVSNLPDLSGTPTMTPYPTNTPRPTATPSN